MRGIRLPSVPVGDVLQARKDAKAPAVGCPIDVHCVKHFVRLIGRWRCIDGSLLWFFLLWMPKNNNGVDDSQAYAGDTASTCGASAPCISDGQAIKAVELVSERIRSVFGSAREFLLTLDPGAPPAVDGPAMLNAETGVETALKPVEKALEDLRRELAVGDLIVRRWHMLLAHLSGREGAEEWILDRNTFPNDVTFNTCVPHLPRLVDEAIQVLSGKRSGFTPIDCDKAGDTLSDHLAYCMLFPPLFLREPKPGGVDPGPGELPGGTNPQDGSKSAIECMRKADGGEQLRAFTWEEDEDNRRREEKTEKWPGWGNTLCQTWSGMAMMHIVGPHRFPKEPDSSGSGSTEEFDRLRLPSDGYIFPLRRYNGQQVGFGLCCLPVCNDLLRSSIEDGPDKWPELFAGCKLSFAWDVLAPEFLRLSERVFVIVLGLGLATLGAIREIVCQQGRQEFSQPYREKLLKVLFGGSTSSPTHATGVDLFIEVVRRDAELTNKLANQLATADVLYAFIGEMQHSFQKHSLGALLEHAEALAPPRVAPPAPHLEPPPEAAVREIARLWPLLYWRRVQNIAQVMMHRMAALEGTARLAWHPEDRKLASNSWSNITMLDLFDFFGTLPGHRMWTATAHGSLEELERIYWRRVRLISHRVPWHGLEPFFYHVRGGVVETALEVLVHNAFKHAPRPPSPKDVDAVPPTPRDEEEDAVRIVVTFHRLQVDGNTVSAIVLADNRPEGFDPGPLADAMVKPGQKPEPLPDRRRLFPPVKSTSGGAEARGQGFHVMLRCLRAQADCIPPLPSLGLFLVNRDAMEQPDEILDGGSGLGHDLRMVLKDLKENFPDATPDTWTLSGRTASGRKVNPDAQGAFVLLQKFTDKEGGTRCASPPAPRDAEKGYSLAILDTAPGPHDSETYRRYFGEEKPSSDYDCFSEVPEIIIQHTAVKFRDEAATRAWFKTAKEKYPAGGPLPLLWLTSESEALQGLATAERHTGTFHEAFWNWCNENLEPVESPEDPKRKENLRKLAEHLSGVGKARRTHEVLRTSLYVCDRVVAGQPVPYLQQRNLVLDYSGLDVPVDPRVRWLLLSAIARGGMDRSQSRDDASKALRRMKADVDFLRGEIFRSRSRGLR